MTAVTVDAPFVSLPLKVLHESPTNPRRMFEAKPMAELVASVREHGVLQPVLVRDRQQAGEEPGSRYEIIAGARRYRAAREAGLLELPCIVRELTDKQTLEVQFIENLQRADLHPLDEGYGYQKLHGEHGYSVEHLAAKLGKSVGYVYGRMQLAKLPTKAQTLFLEGKIDLSHAQLVGRIPVVELAEKAAQDIAKGDQWGGKPMAYRAAVEYVRRNYQCNLKNAPFSTRDSNLVPSAGACGGCPKRSGNQKDLFGGVDGVGTDTCTDPQCYESKVRAAFEATKAEVLSKGGKVLQGKKAEGARYSSEFIDPKSECWEDPKRRRYDQMAKGHEIAPVLIEGRDGEAVIRWSRADVSKALKLNGHKIGAHPPSSSAEELRQKKAHKARLETIAATVPCLVEKAEAVDAAVAWRLVIEHGLTRTDGRNRVKKRRGSMPDIDTLTAAQLQGLAVEIIAVEFASSHYSTGFSKSWTAACKALGVLTMRTQLARWIDRAELPLSILGIKPKAAGKEPKAKGKAKPKPTAKAKKAKPGSKPKAAEAHDVYHGAMAGRGGSPRMGD